MATDPSDMRLNDDDRRLLADAERKSGKNWRKLLREAFAEVKQRPPTELLSADAKASILEMLDEFEKMPMESPDDGFSNRDHDKVLYGGK